MEAGRKRPFRIYTVALVGFICCAISFAQPPNVPTPTDNIGGGPGIVIPPTTYPASPSPSPPYGPLSVVAFYGIVGGACVLLCLIGICVFFTYQRGICCFKREKRSKFDSEPMQMNSSTGSMLDGGGYVSSSALPQYSQPPAPAPTPQYNQNYGNPPPQQQYQTPPPQQPRPPGALPPPPPPTGQQQGGGYGQQQGQW